MNNSNTTIYIVAAIIILHFVVGFGYLVYKLNKKYKNKIYETFKEKMGKVLLKFDSDLFTSYEAFESNLISIIS